MNAWVLLFVAGLLEIVWAVALKYSDGFSKLWPSVGAIIFMALSFWLLAAAMKTLPVGTAYAVWTGIGAAGTFILSIFLLGEDASLPRIFCVALIICGIVGLKFFDGRA